MVAALRRLVSEDRVRCKDHKLGLDLDLAYITDRIIVMGFPAAGLQGVYRNRRDHVKRFLDHHHGEHYWVFNLCPLRENSYHASAFGERVSRYPFPDHHVPPFSLIPIVCDEIHSWLTGSPKRVAVLHCKAGKGRSGMLACAYLVFLHYHPQNSFRTDLPPSLLSDLAHPGTRKVVDGTENIPVAPTGADVVDAILTLHTSRRIRPRKLGVSRHGVSLPSQQRWLLYWSNHLASRQRDTVSHSSTVCVRRVRLLISDESPNGNPLNGPLWAGCIKDRIWASFSRYRDELNNVLSEKKLELKGADQVRPSPFHSGKWDKKEMVKQFDSIRHIASFSKTELALEKFGGKGVVLDVNREVLVKLHFGTRTVGWMWFIPSKESMGEGERISIERGKIDGLKGLGKHLHKVEIEFNSVTC